MKKKLFEHIVILAAASLLVSTVSAATVSITPASITNDYTGKITISISGLAANQNVRIEKYFDLNTNGVLDAADVMCRSYMVRDGKQPSIGGVRLSNVPADEDGATNGQIVVKLWYPGISEGIDLIAGSYLFKVSDGTNGTALATNVLVVQQKSYPQGVTGQLTASGSGAVLSNTTVVLLPGDGGPVTGGFTDGTGHYTLYCAPGEYVVLPLKAGYVGDFSGGAAVSPNSFSTVDLSLATATRTISGKLQDSLSATGVAGIFIQAESAAGQFVSCFTDVGGTFSLAVTDGQWKLEPDGGQLAEVGYIGWNDGLGVSVNGANLENVALPVIKANALIYGTVQDSGGQPVSGLELGGQDSSHVYDPRGRSFPTNGSYCLAVFGGSWQVGPSSSSLQTLGLLGQYAPVTVATNQAVRQDFTLFQYNAHILGRVIDNNSNGVASLGIEADNHQGVFGHADTDANGYFDLSAFGGTWNLSISQEDAQQAGLIGSGNLSVTITNGETRSNVIFTVQRSTAQICGRVVNGSGEGIGGVSVHFSLNNSSTMLGAQADNNGYFCGNVYGGDWQVSVEQNDLQSRGLISSAPDTVTVTDGSNQNNVIVTVQALTGQVNGTVYDNNNNPVVNLGVWGFATLNGLEYGQYTWTDNNGYFALGLCNGSWQIGLDCGGGVGLQSRGYECPPGVQTNFVGGALTLNFVVHPPTPLQITTTNLPNGTVGQWYSQQLTAIGGQFPYHWCFGNGSGPLPSGLELSDSGFISGTPTNIGSYTFRARVYDNTSLADTNLTITIQGEGHPQITQYWRPAPGQFDIVIEGLTSGQYHIQYSTNLGSGWSYLITTNITGTMLHFHDTAATNGYRFYRVLR